MSNMKRPGFIATAVLISMILMPMDADAINPFKRGDEIDRRQRVIKSEELPKNEPAEMTRGRALGAYLRGIYSRKRGYIPDALNAFKSSELFFKDNSEILYELSELLFLQGSNDEALQTISRANETGSTPVNDKIQYLKARIYMERHDDDTAFIYLKNIPETSPISDNISYWLGVMASRKGENDTAIRYLKRSIELNPYLESAYFDLGAVYIRMEDFAKATESFKNILIISPFDILAHLSLGLLEEYTGNIEQAKKHFQAVWLIDESHSMAPLKLAEFEFRDNNDTRAFKIIETALNIHKTDIPFMYEVCELYNKHNYIDKSISLYNNLLRLDQNQLRARIEIGTLYIKQDQLKKASVHLEKALSLDPDNMGLIVTLGYIYFKEKQVLKTRNLLFETVHHILAHQGDGDSKSDDTNPELRKQLINLLYYTGLLLDENKNYDDAMDCFEKILLLDKENTKAMNYIGYTLTEKGENLNRARNLITKALDIEPTNGYFIDSLGWLLYKEGHINDALTELLRAKKMAGDNDVILEHIGDVYFVKGMFKEAVRHWKSSLELNPSNNTLFQKIKNAESQIKP